MLNTNFKPEFSYHSQFSRNSSSKIEKIHLKGTRFAVKKNYWKYLKIKEKEYLKISVFVVHYNHIRTDDATDYPLFKI